MAIESSSFGPTKLTGDDAGTFLRQIGIRVEGLVEQAKAARQMADSSMVTYASQKERAALRCALGDAAHLCDAVARDIESRFRRRKTVTKAGQEMATIAKMCGDAIWQMREQISVPQGD